MGISELSVEGFLSHEASARGGSYLKNWKDPKRGGKGFIDVWLHRGCSFAVALWRHPVPKFDIVEDERTHEPKRIVRVSNELCPEEEDVLRKQRWRDRETGALSAPPTCCPIHRLTEHFHQLVKSGELPLEQVVFNFDAGDGKPLAYHAGGICGMFNDDLEDKEWARLNAAGIYAQNAWKENWAAKLNYVFRVVDNNNPTSCAIAVEPNLLGDKMKVEIRKAMTPGVWGPKRGNPIENPYCFRWEAHPEQQEFQKRYDVLRMEGIALTPAVDKLISKTEPPSIDGLTKEPNWATLRSQLERGCLVDLPWDEFFGNEIKNVDKKAEKIPEVRTNGVKVNGISPVTKPTPKSTEPEMVACDDCEKPMLVTDPKCMNCGKQYEVEASTPPPPPPMKKRSAAVPTMRTASKPTPIPVPEKPAPAAVSGYGDGFDIVDEGDQIPFCLNTTLVGGACELWNRVR